MPRLRKGVFGGVLRTALVRYLVVMRNYDTDDTIVAIASAPGQGPRGIVRLSGPNTIGVLESCFTAHDCRSLRAVVAAQHIAGSIDVSLPIGKVPCELLLWPSQRSYTRQVAAELHLPGAPPLLNAVQRTLMARGARMAEPGEFTLRAFLAGRIDLLQAEAVLGVVDAANDSQLRLALNQLAGGLHHPVVELRKALLELLADLEANLDFADQDIQFLSRAELARKLNTLENAALSLLGQMRSRSIPHPYSRVILRGWPNTGKSSLLNALAEDAVSLVADTHGTTRDYVRTRVEWNNLVCELIDTAGHPAALPTSAIHDMAERQTAMLRDYADLELFCLEATRPINAWESAQLAEPPRAPRVVVLTKIDAVSTVAATWPGAIPTSSQTGFGIEHLRTEICRQLRARNQASSASVMATTMQRGHRACTNALDSIRRAKQVNEEQLGEELVAAELRIALEHIGQIAGVVYTDELLDHIFSRFCIGK